jgi:poly(3-hydroxybutyrate) depolymerase/1,4-dihydroxy-2-naphthoate octaprenyltransferase
MHILTLGVVRLKTMKRLRGLLQACHFGPSVLVTTVAFLIAQALWWEGPAYVIAVGVLLGQLIVGWTNDLHDYEDDLKHNRVAKPLVSGLITPKQLRTAIFVVTPLAVIVNLFGPLGLKGGAVYLLGIAFGLAYNFYFKYTPLSPLPYVIAFAALPASVVLAVDEIPPLWMMAAGSLLGVAAHIANVLKDFDEDGLSGIRSFPRIIGERASRLSIAVILLATTVLLNSVSSRPALLIVGIVGALLTIKAPRSILFKAIMIVALANLVLLISALSDEIGNKEFADKTSIIIGADRPAELFLPTSNQSNEPSGILLDLHGYGGNSMSQTSYTFLKQAALDAGLAYLAPDGTKDRSGTRFWNASNACCDFAKSGVNDVDYIDSLIDEISDSYDLDKSRIYLFGHSNGHFMSYTYLCTSKNKVAAIAGLAGSMDVDSTQCSGKSGNVLHIHGDSDGTISYTGGSLFSQRYQSVDEVMKGWSNNNQCTAKPENQLDVIAAMSGPETTSYPFDCTKGSLELWKINGGVHVPELDRGFADKVVSWLTLKS